MSATFLRLERSKLRRSLVAYTLILPAVIIYAAMILAPSVNTVFLSTLKWDGVNPVRTPVGLANYVEALGDPKIYNALANNLIWLAILVTVPLAVALLLSVAVTKRDFAGRDQFQAIYFIPHVLSPVVVALIWSWVYDPTVGLLSHLLRWLQVVDKPYGVLGDPDAALYSLIFTNIWGDFGFCTVIYVNALQTIDQSLYDAATIDGADAFRRFIHVTLPGISSVTTFLVLLNMINSFKVFNQVFLMTTGGPLGRTEVVGYVMFIQAFKLNRVGYGSAIAVLLTVIILVVGVFYLANRERRMAQ